jgi:hypothetical protein
VNGIPRPKKCVYCGRNDGKTVFIVPIGWVHMRCKDIGSRAIEHYILDLVTGERSLEFFCGSVLRIIEANKEAVQK